LYGKPIFVSIVNFAPSDKRGGAEALAALTLPEPSIIECCLGSASSSNMSPGAAGTKRSTETIFDFVS
jgi:hypothetical protein